MDGLGDVASRAAPVAIDKGLSRGQRMEDSWMFREAFAQDRSYRGRYMVLWLRSADDASLKLGVIASKKTLARSVDRSRARRLLRESFRLNRYRFKSVVDVVLLARRAIKGAMRQDVEADLLVLAKNSGMLVDPQ